MPKRVLITGGAKRIGRAIAQAFAAAGYQLVIHANQSLQEAKDLAEQLGGKDAGHAVVQCDFRNLDAVSRLIPQLAQDGLTPDVLVNSASHYTRIPLDKTEPSLAQDIYTVNFLAPYELMRGFKCVVGRGSIINLTDQRTAFIDPPAGIYGLAKKSLRDATEACALAWAPHVRVNAVAPGIVLPPPGADPTKMAALIPKIPLQARTTEQEIAQACLFLAETPCMTGQTLFLDGGLHLLGQGIETRH